jgi:N-acetylglucosamine malate deacetylase 1
MSATCPDLSARTALSPLAVIARAGAARVLVLLAHPDDEVLLCGATIAALADAECHVRVVCFCDGAQGRNAVFPQACKHLGATGELLCGQQTSAMVLDGALVAITDSLLRHWQPDCVITHTRAGRQNQDHVVLHDAVRLSTARCRWPTLLLAAEPPLSSVDFIPTVFADVDRYFAIKCQAAQRYRDVLDRDYMTDEYLGTRARWWGQVAGRPRTLVEPFELVLWR